MATLTGSEVTHAAYDIVRDHLEDGVEFLSITEILYDNYEEPDEEDWRVVDIKVNQIINNLIDLLVDMETEERDNTQ